MAEDVYNSCPSQAVSLVVWKSEMGHVESQLNLGLFVLQKKLHRDIGKVHELRETDAMKVVLSSLEGVSPGQYLLER